MMSFAPSAAPFLLIDAGNSRIKWALTDAGGTRIAVGAFAHERGALLSLPEPDWSMLPIPGSVWIANVAGERTARRLETLTSTRWPHAPRHTVSAQPSLCGVRNSYRDYRQLGSDRWASLIGARATYPAEHLLIATLGTATTLEALYADGTFAGGLIAPGGTMMMQSLGQHTALLPTAEPMTEGQDPHGGQAGAPFAVDTQTALHEGCLLAQASLIERAWRDLCTQIGAPVRCVLSGGAAKGVSRLLTIDYTYHEHLVLTGLALIAREHVSSSSDSSMRMVDAS
ncbi:type III pantothenate kinase [Mycoavidus sp. SF9855]|uniref:type III pantothenate kinase n=1 Tax=Mycoavidus sp. SF9855 TaxID=2968475 RepID=UPI00211C9C83|nr:type III pantothenate kinase [Mycoavidus sp. SF9855]UUM21509.1 type III pantothenate kinase [Mycoavidus sp. SF9855]